MLFAVSTKCLEREQCLAASGLDLTSCLHFLLDLYSQWTTPQVCNQYIHQFILSTVNICLTELYFLNEMISLNRSFRHTCALNTPLTPHGLYPCLRPHSKTCPIHPPSSSYNIPVMGHSNQMGVEPIARASL